MVTGPIGDFPARPGAYGGSMRAGANALGESMLAIVVATVASSLALLAFGHAPLMTWTTMVERTLLRPSGLQEVVVRAIPLLIVGVAVLLTTKAGVWNIGVDGQVLIAALAAAVTANVLDGTVRWVMWIGALLAAALAGAVWAFVPAMLRARHNLNEIVTTIMFNYVAISLTAWLVKGPLRDPELVAPQTASIARAMRFPALGDTRVHVGIFLALAVWAGGSWWLSQTEAGFNLRAVGASPRASAHAMIRVGAVTFSALVGSGALAGLAGANDVLATKGTFQAEWNPLYGLSAFALVFLARQRPAGVLPAALFLGWLGYAGDVMPRAADVPSAFFVLFEGILLIVLAALHWRPWTRLGAVHAR